MTGRRRVRVDSAVFERRLLTDLFSDALAEQWMGRAEEFRLAAPRIGDFIGLASRDQLRTRWHRCVAASQACRNHAALVSTYGLPADITADIEAVLDERAA